MLRFMKSKSGMALTMAWLFAWLMLEMVFYGEPIFCYGSKPEGYCLYLVTLAAVAACSVGVAVCFLRSRWLGRAVSRKSLLAYGAVGSACLLGIRLLMGSGSSLDILSVVCGVVFAILSPTLLGLLACVTLGLVHERGLREVLGAVLVGVALSFFLLPRPLRDGPYGLVLVVLSPAAIASALWVLWRADFPFAAPVDVPGDVAVPVSDTHSSEGLVLASLAALGLLSFLTYLLAYFDFVSAGFRVVVEEDPYFYLAVFTLIGILLTVLFLSPSERVFTESTFLYVMAGIVILTLFVLFGLLNYLYSGGDYVYTLTKFLRRAVKILALFMTAVLIYQSGLQAAPAFLLVVIVPLVLGKVVQMAVASVPSLTALVAGSEFLYLLIIGFSILAAWVLFLVLYVQGTVVGYSRKAQEEVCFEGEAEKPLASFATAHALTDRECDVLGYLAAGYSVRAISSALCLSENTIKTHVASIYRKTDTHSRQEIIDLVGKRP